MTPDMDLRRTGRARLAIVEEVLNDCASKGEVLFGILMWRCCRGARGKTIKAPIPLHCPGLVSRQT